MPPILLDPSPDLGLFSSAKIILGRENVKKVNNISKKSLKNNSDALRMAGQKDEPVNEEYVHEISEARKKIDMGFKQSTFLHTSGYEPRSLQQYYHHLKPQASSGSLHLYDNIQVNRKFFAFPWKTTGGSGLRIHSLSDFGRCNDSVPLIRGHREQISTYSLSTITDNLVATGSNDGIINV